MRIAVLGAGFTGLTAAYQLAKKGHRVAIFEKEDKAGGLAHGFKLPGWTWYLEESYHHFFASDNAALSLIKELGLSDKLFFKKPVTGVYCGQGDTFQVKEKDTWKVEELPRCCQFKTKNEKRKMKNEKVRNLELEIRNSSIFPLDTPLSFLSFPYLSLYDKLKSGLALAYLKITPTWKNLEKTPAKDWIEKHMGKRIWQTLWEPLFINKFGQYLDQVPASWFWARIKKRSQALGYFQGGYQTLANALVEKIKKLGGKVYFNSEINSEMNYHGQSPWYPQATPSASSFSCASSTPKPRGGFRASKIKQLRQEKNKWKITIQDCSQSDPGSSNSSNKTVKRSGSKFRPGSKRSTLYDAIVVTLPTPIFLNITPQLPINYVKRLSSIKHLTAQTLILELKRPFLQNTYWLNICDSRFPFLLLVDHTNFIDKKYYGQDHILYIGNYLPKDHPYLSKSKEELLKLFLPYLKKINPGFNSKLDIRNSKLFFSPFAQPVITLDYSQKIKSLTNPLPKLLLANQDLIYPWDRGVNYAIELGKKTASLL